MLRRSVAGFAMAFVLLVSPAFADTAFRFTDMDLRDPHMFVNFIGCRDVTDTPLVGFSINGELQASLTTDADSSGDYDESYVLLFTPLDPGAASGTLRFGPATCSAETPNCFGGANGPFPVTNYQNSTDGTCLGTLPGTVRPYVPAVTTTGFPCFVTDEMTLTIDLSGIPLTLRNARVSGRYAGTPATSITNGLIRGFVSEADANNTTIPASFPLIGGQRLSALLPGGDPPGAEQCCASHNDKDIVDGVQGWWFYFNFTASEVPYAGTVAVEPGRAGVFLGPASPNPFSGSLSLAYALESTAMVRVSVFDTRGRRVADLVRSVQPSGNHTTVWDGRDASGTRVGAGVYHVRLEALGRSESRRVVLLK